MNRRLVVDSENQLHELREPSFHARPAALRVAAKIISYLFHPVFLPVYVVWFLVFVHPYLFAGFTDMQKFQAMMMAVISFTVFPLVTVLLLKGLNFIDSIYLHSQRDRVIPFIACMIWYFWIAYVWYNFGKTSGGIDMPREAIQFATGAFISTVIGLMVNIRMKVSLHAISVGIILTFFLMMAFTQPLNFGVWLSVVFLVTGLVCTARFIVSDHSPAEIYWGIITGAASMILAWIAGSLL